MVWIHAFSPFTTPDFTTQKKGFRRDVAFHRIKNEHPTMLRFFVFAYGKPSKLWVMHLGQVVECIQSWIQ